MQNYNGFLDSFDFCKVAILYLGAFPTISFTIFLSKSVKIDTELTL